MNRSLQPLICVLHENELHFNHLFENLDGKSNSQDVLTGKIGRKITPKGGLKLVTDINEIVFEPLGVEGNEELFEMLNDILEHWNPREMSNDLLYFAKMLQVLITGEITEDLLKLKPPHVSTNRWINTASNTIRLYFQEKEPWFELKRLIQIIAKLYAMMCFLIRIHWQCTNGSKLYFESLKRARSVLNTNEMEVFMKVWRDNSFWGHPEQVLLCAVTDPDEKIRLWAYETMLKAQENQIKLAKDKRFKFTFRKFLMPSEEGYLNENAEMYTELCGNFDQIPFKLYGVPPLFQDHFKDEISKNDFKQYVINGNLPPLDIPCHSQSVERLVALTSSAALAVIGYENRHAFLLNKEKACPKFPIHSGPALKSHCKNMK